MPQALEQADGRWAWVVLLASLVTQALTVGFPSCIGVFFTDLQRDFQASNSETSWFPSIMGAMLHCGGPLCSILIKRFGCRVTMMLGGVLASLGMVASTFSDSLIHLFLTAGLITGPKETDMEHEPRSLLHVEVEKSYKVPELMSPLALQAWACVSASSQASQ